MQEFELITHYFSSDPKNGDDAADITPPPHHRLVTSVDTSVAGKHFLEGVHPNSIGHKSLAVSLSDIAAMGAKPTSCLLSLTLQKANDTWLKAFAAGFYQLAKKFDVSLVGGDTTHGPLSITTIVFGILPNTITPLRRDGAQIGDLVVVSGQLGSAAHAYNHADIKQTPLNFPTPRIELGTALRGIATSCIDISDGFAQDLSHILMASQVGAKIHTSKLPLGGTADEALTGGDDYELCFTIPEDKQSDIENISQQLELPLTVVGSITQDSNLTLLDKNDKVININTKGFQHF